MNLGDLKDVSLEDPISSSDVLVYNEQTKHWENRALEDHLETYNPTTSVKVDETSIESVNGSLQLKDFGTGYFAYVPAVKNEETGKIITPSTYKYTEGFKSGLEIRVTTIDGKLSLAWYEPGTETVEDVAANIEAISKEVEALDTIINGENGLSNQIDSLNSELDQKANSNSVYSKSEIDLTITNLTNAIYTKKETDTAISSAIAAAGHLKRKKLDSEETIDVTAEDADQYIYMVPTGLTEDDDKYDEYMVIDGVVEKVGSWEISLDNYATVDYLNAELAKKVDANPGERLLTDLEATKLSTIEMGAQKNYITSVDENQFTVNDGQLILKAISQSSVTGLESALAMKANATAVTDLASILNQYKENNDARIATLEGRLVWAPLEDEIV